MKDCRRVGGDVQGEGSGSGIALPDRASASCFRSPPTCNLHSANGRRLQFGRCMRREFIDLELGVGEVKFQRVHGAGI